MTAKIISKVLWFKDKVGQYYRHRVEVRHCSLKALVNMCDFMFFTDIPLYVAYFRTKSSLQNIILNSIALFH